MIANCPHCSNEFYVPFEQGGNVIDCTRCKGPVKAPMLDKSQIESNFPQLLVGHEIDQKCLVGLDGFAVYVATCQNAEALGLSSKKIKTEVELRLRQMGINIIAKKDDLLKHPRMPLLAVSVQVMQGPKHYAAFRYEIQLYQKTQLCNGSDDRYVVSTWRRSVFGSRNTEKLPQVREGIKDHIDELINDYFAANPKKTPANQQ